MELKLTASRTGRLSSFLKGELRMSSGLINRLKWGDSIRVNGCPQHTDHQVVPGDCITVSMQEEAPEYPAQHTRLDVLYEDEWLLAVDKPAGMLIHPSRSRNEGTLANFVQGYYETACCQAAFHPLTRLDRDTYGLVLIAKDSHTGALLQAGKLQKTYHAVTFGIPAHRQGTIDAPIARRPLPSLLREVSPEGKPCMTEFAILKSRGCLAKLSLSPITGRTHQLRIHCAHIGCPILGDPQYGSEASALYSQQHGLHTQLLCAHSLILTHPYTGKNISLLSHMDAEIHDDYL